MENLPDLFQAAIRLEQTWHAMGYRFCFIGGIAVQRWGEPRSTIDVDVSLLTGFGDEGHYLDSILETFEPRIQDARRFALLNRVLLIRDQRGTPIDVALAAMPFEERTIERATRFSLNDADGITTCSASDLIVHKAFANRDVDWRDIRSILIRSANEVDQATVLAELTPLVELKEEPEILEKLRKLFTDCEFPTDN